MKTKLIISLWEHRFTITTFRGERLGRWEFTFKVHTGSRDIELIYPIGLN